MLLYSAQRLAQLYVNIFMPALPVSAPQKRCFCALRVKVINGIDVSWQAAFMYQLQGRYLQNQVRASRRLPGAVYNLSLPAHQSINE